MQDLRGRENRTPPTHQKKKKKKEKKREADNSETFKRILKKMQSSGTCLHVASSKCIDLCLLMM